MCFHLLAANTLEHPGRGQSCHHPAETSAPSCYYFLQLSPALLKLVLTGESAGQSGGRRNLFIVSLGHSESREVTDLASPGL